MSGYHAKKRLGQNFLNSPEIIEKIASLLELKPDDNAIEIGPGRGALTLELAATGASITAVEFDRDLIGYLNKLLEDYDNVDLVHGDFLEFAPDIERFKLIGNIPYNLTSPVIGWCAQHAPRIESVVLMVQKEFANRLAAKVGTKDWSPISIFTQLTFDVTIEFDVAAKHFSPPPKITSSVIKLIPKETPNIADMARLDTLVRASFKQRRKLLLNNLVPEIIPDKQKALEIYEKLGMDHRIRAEQVSIDLFLKLADALV